jgi:hypothetical protein
MEGVKYAMRNRVLVERLIGDSSLYSTALSIAVLTKIYSISDLEALRRV